MQILKTVELAEKFLQNSKIFGEKMFFWKSDSRVEIPSKYPHVFILKKTRKYWD